MGVIYKATNLINGKSYIGQTIDFERRKKDHLRKNKPEKYKYTFQKAIEKYGEENFEWSILEDNVPKEKLNEREVYWIAYYDTYNSGYNETLGGDNADALISWQKNNPDKVYEHAMKNLEYAKEYWRQHPEEQEKEIKAFREKGVEAVKKKIRCIELDLVFDSLTDAERWSQSAENPNGKKASHQHIAHVCRGHRYSCGGYRWEYVIDNK